MISFKEMFNRISGKRKVMALLGLSTVSTIMFGTGMSILTGNKLWLIYVFIISFIGFTFLFSLTEESHDEL